jgi:hypothetical protein
MESARTYLKGNLKCEEQKEEKLLIILAGRGETWQDAHVAWLALLSKH